MRETEKPVVIAFIIVIGVLLYNYVAEHARVNSELRLLIDQQQQVIDRKTKENQILSRFANQLYFQLTGRQIPTDWTHVEESEKNPVH